MNNEPGVREQAPERIYMHPTSAEANVNPWPLEPGEYVEYIRADLAATRMRDLCVAKVRESKYYDRGEGLEDEDPHSDNNPDYIRAAIDERLEDVAHDLESLTLDGEKEQTRS